MYFILPASMNIRNKNFHHQKTLSPSPSLIASWNSRNSSHVDSSSLEYSMAPSWHICGWCVGLNSIHMCLATTSFIARYNKVSCFSTGIEWMLSGSVLWCVIYCIHAKYFHCGCYNVAFNNGLKEVAGSIVVILWVVDYIGPLSDIP